MSEPLYSTQPNKNPSAQPQDPQSSPLKIKLDRKAEIEAELPILEAAVENATERGIGFYHQKQRAGQLRAELSEIEAWLATNQDRFEDPYPPDAA